MKNYRELEREFNYKVKSLQKQCKHKKFKEIGEYEIKGHIGKQTLVKCCFCNRDFFIKK